MKTQLTEHGRLNERQAVYLRLWQQTGFNPALKDDCAGLAGYRGEHPAQGPMQSKAVRSIFERAMADNGLTIDALVKTHKAALRATKPVAVKIVGADRKEVIERPDHAIRLRAVELGYNSMALMPSRASIHLEKRETNFNFDVDTLHRAEAASGEKIIDAETVSEEPDDLDAPF